MITSDLIERRLNNFWGYGSLEAPVWFVGMEEGLGSDEELEARFRAADGKTTVDLRLDMKSVPSHMGWFQPSTDVQASWKYPMALYLFIRDGGVPSYADILTYQLYSLGGIANRQTAVLELMPLPAINTETWHYQNYVDRKVYRRT